LLTLLKIQTSNFGRRLKVRHRILNNNAQLIKTGRGLDHVQNLGPVTLYGLLKPSEMVKSENTAFDFQHGS